MLQISTHCSPSRSVLRGRSRSSSNRSSSTCSSSTCSSKRPCVWMHWTQPQRLPKCSYLQSSARAWSPWSNGAWRCVCHPTIYPETWLSILSIDSTKQNPWLYGSHLLSPLHHSQVLFPPPSIYRGLRAELLLLLCGYTLIAAFNHGGTPCFAIHRRFRSTLCSVGCTSRTSSSATQDQVCIYSEQVCSSELEQQAS